MQHFLTIQILINVASVYFAFSVAVLSCCMYDLNAFLAMDINALVISGSDLGAVPSGSTNIQYCGNMGSK